MELITCEWLYGWSHLRYSSLPLGWVGVPTDAATQTITIHEISKTKKAQDIKTNCGHHTGYPFTSKSWPLNWRTSVLINRGTRQLQSCSGRKMNEDTADIQCALGNHKRRLHYLDHSICPQHKDDNLQIVSGKWFRGEVSEHGEGWHFIGCSPNSVVILKLWPFSKVGSGRILILWASAPRQSARLQIKWRSMCWTSGGGAKTGNYNESQSKRW